MHPMFLQMPPGKASYVPSLKIAVARGLLLKKIPLYSQMRKRTSTYIHMVNIFLLFQVMLGVCSRDCTVCVILVLPMTYQ